MGQMANKSACDRFVSAFHGMIDRSLVGKTLTVRNIVLSQNPSENVSLYFILETESGDVIELRDEQDIYDPEEDHADSEDAIERVSTALLVTAEDAYEIMTKSDL